MAEDGRKGGKGKDKDGRSGSGDGGGGVAGQSLLDTYTLMSQQQPTARQNWVEVQ